MRRIGIVNRGEPAIRFLDALADLRHCDAEALLGVALYVTADARSLFVQRADDAVCIGADRLAYLDAKAVLDGLRSTGCDAAWLGWGFASEDATFVAALEAAGITVLAPRAETMAALGDKIRAKQAAEAHGVPVAAWAVVEDAEQAALAAARVGYPLLLKAAGGGGGRGIRRVDRPEDLLTALDAARDEAARAFAGTGVLIEKLVDGARHVEVQILGDGEGAVIALGVRDCSVQRRRQKVLEECPSPALPEAIASQLTESAVALCAALRYRSAGTVEFLYDPAADAAYFLEVNTRLQVEHPVTEAVYGVDLVHAQIAIARGEGLPIVGPPRGWAIEARVCAEDPHNAFAPAPGRLARLVLPTGPGVRVDCGFAEGETLSSEFDPLVAKVIAWGADRPTALGRLARALDQLRLVVEGGQSNVAFLRSLLDHPAVMDGTADVGLLDRMRPEAPPGEAAAVVTAAIDRFLARGDRAQAGADRHRVELSSPVRVYRTGANCFRLVSDEGALTARYDPEDAVQVRLELDGRAHRVERAAGDTTFVVDGVPHRVAAGAAGVVTAPSMGVVLALSVEDGQPVAAGDPVVVLESMKMEVRVDAPLAGTVRQICVHPGEQVRPDQVLLVLDTGDAVAVRGPRLPWEDAPPPPDRAAIRLTTAVIGWDIEPGRFEADLARLDAPGCLKLLNTFADVAELFEGRPRGEVQRTGAADVVTPQLLLQTLRKRGPDALSPRRRTRLRRALKHHGIEDLQPSDQLAGALMRIQRAGANRRSSVRAAVAAIRALEAIPHPLLDRLAHLDPERFGDVCAAASRARYEQYERPAIERLTQVETVDGGALLEAIDPSAPDWVDLARAPLTVISDLAARAADGWEIAAEAVARRVTGAYQVALPRTTVGDLPAFIVGDTLVVTADADRAGIVIADLRSHSGPAILVLPGAAELEHVAEPRGRAPLCLVAAGPPVRVLRVDPRGTALPRFADVLPRSVQRFDLARLDDFELQRLPADPEVLLFLAQARDNPDDRRLLAYGEVRSLRRRRGRRLHLPHVDRVFHAAVRAIEAARDVHDPKGRLQWNRLTLVIGPIVPLGMEVVRRYVTRLAPAAEHIGLEKVVLRARFGDADATMGAGPLTDISIYDLSGQRQEFVLKPASMEPLRPRTVYESKVVAARRRGQVHPYEIVSFLRRGGTLPPGVFEEWDLVDGTPRSVAGRAPGLNTAAVVFGVITSTPTKRKTPLTRVLLLSDPTHRMGALAEAECRRVIAALDLAEARGVPLEWVAVSAGARIDWESGTENLDWTAKVLRRIVEFTQAGGEVNIIVPGICVGAQAYWNAEATMMMHSRGLLIMTDRGTMVLTGKRALDASGCVSAEDDLALGGYTAIMGPNGQAQCHASDLGAAYRLLYRYYAATYVEPGRTRPQPVPCRDRADRDIRAWPYPPEAGHGFGTVGQIFSANPERKRPFAVRPIMEALIDRGQRPVERWAGWREAETAVVWEARIGGHGAMVIGIDNQPKTRLDAPPTGPSAFAGGTLYPQSSRKIARALNAASGRRPAVVLANLSGFDGSPESLARWQLEYGAEIGRAVVNFAGPIIFVVLSRYHGGAYVVFSKTLNPGLTTVALEGSFASVIGGAPAATVVFAGEVRRETAARGGGESTKAQVIAELAAKFDGVHSVARAHAVGSIDAIIEAGQLRPWIIERLARD